MTDFLLVIDRGATTTVLTLRDASGRIIYEGISTGSNYHVIGTNAFRKVILNLLRKLLKTQTVSTIKVGVFALAGIDTEEDHKVLTKEINEVLNELSLTIIDLIVENDAYPTLVGVTENQPGVLVISGTGSIAFAHDGKGGVSRSGGWGHRSGDEGSGYWIGKQIIQSIFRMEDGRGPETVLKEKVFTLLKLHAINDLTAWLYGKTYSVDTVASLSLILDEAIDQEDAEAGRILQEAVMELTKLATSVINTSKLTNESCTVYFNGGTIKNFGKLFHLLKTEVESKDSKKNVVLCHESPIESIYKRAKLRYYEQG